MQMLKPPKRPLLRVPLDLDECNQPEVLEDYDPPCSYPPPSIWKPVKVNKSLYDAASPELKATLDAASADVEKWEPWQRSVPWDGHE